MSCRSLKDHQGAAEGPIRAMLVRDDRAWVSGGRTDPWIALFDAVMGEQSQGGRRQIQAYLARVDADWVIG